jgi:uncharacterized OB-fold protein
MTTAELGRHPAVADDLFTDEPRLIGSRCRACGTVTFPRQGSCPRCTSSDVERHLLARRGVLWTWTVQRFEPKSPPYAGTGEFEPFAVGYVELPDEVRVETRLVECEAPEIGIEMELTTTPAPGPVPRVTYAFRPVIDR